MTGLRLRPLRVEDEAAVLAAHEVMAADGFEFALGHEPGLPWDEYLAAKRGERAGTDLPEGWVPGTFLVADAGGEIVGRTSVRHELNDFLLREGGHIGYGVLPAYRRRGFATEILLQSLVVARAEGVDRVLVTCDDDNVGSATVIERCGGVLDPDLPIAPSTPPKRRYWIP